VAHTSDHTVSVGIEIFYDKSKKHVFLYD